MNILKKLIVGTLLAVNTAALCGENNESPEEVKNEYNYWGWGVGMPTFFSAKFGHREQVGHRGFEYGVGVTPLVYVTEAHLFATALYYPKPNLKRQSYYGVGLKGGGIIELKRAKFGYVAPGFVIGKEKAGCDDGRRFTQVAFGLGALTTDGFKYFPSINLTFGYAF